MIITNEDILLRNCLAQKVKQYKRLIDSGRPYVWELRLSLNEFCQLELALKNSCFSHGGNHNHLLSEEYAQIVVIYLAEWYKRYYKGADSVDVDKVLSLSTDELKSLFQFSGIDYHTFVYNASKNPDKTSYRWLESLQVLGGLAVKAELKRDSNDALLPQLCKIFHGEDIDINNIKDRNRAVAFQESISHKHSLYEYLDCILDKEKDLPFAVEDINDDTTDIPLLIERIQNADREAMKYKFDFEWIISYNANRNQMVRALKVKLKPEIIGGGRKQYIGYDRLCTPEWGVVSPENIGRLEFYLNFKKGTQLISTSSEAIFKYHNTGSSNTGFLCVGRIDEAVYSNVPIERFNQVEIVLKYDDVSQVVQTLSVKDYIQVYSIKGTSNKFSSRKNSQAATVVIFSSDYRLAEDYRELNTVYAHFRNKDLKSENYCWCPITDKIVLIGPDNKEIMPPFFNRNGLYQVVTKKYLRTIKYKDNTYVLYRYVDMDYEEGEIQEEHLPVLFGRQGLEVKHYATVQSKDSTSVVDYDLEWMKNGHYVDWDNEEPPQGELRIRVTVKGIVFKARVYYVPFETTAALSEPIWRDFENHRICTAIPGVEDVDDDFKLRLDYRESDTRQLEIGKEEAKILVDVYRPVILRELSQEGKIVSYTTKDENIEVPLLNCRQFSVRDFSELGVKEYSLNLNNTAYYSFTTFDKPNMHIDNYSESRSVSELSTDIQLDYLKIYITKPLDYCNDMWVWNYKDDPFKASNVNELKEDGIVFQSLMENPTPRHYAMPTIRKSKAGWGGKKKQVEVDVLKCFRTAASHKTYFFIFNPLIKCVHEGKQIEEILIPLLKNNTIFDEPHIVTSLFEFALQFHFDWMLLPRNWWKVEIERASSNEIEKKNLEDKLIKFFKLTSKIIDDREEHCLDNFLEQYWTFNDWPKIDSIADIALKLILDKPDALIKFDSMKDFLKSYDECRFKFSDMSKVVYNEYKDK